MEGTPRILIQRDVPSSHPRWERNLNTGESTLESSRTEVARQTIFQDARRPSRITLTIVER